MSGLTGFLVAIVLAVAGAAWYGTRKRQQTEAGSANREDALAAPKQQATAAIGQEMAAAQQAEADRLASRDHGSSPMPNERYDDLDARHRLAVPEPVAFEREIAALCTSFAARDAAGRDAMRASLDQQDLYTLLHFVERCAVFAMRGASADQLEAGFVAVAMLDGDRIDWRDLLAPIGVLDHATFRVGGDRVGLFALARSLGTKAVGELLQRQVEGAPSELSDSLYAEVLIDGKVGLLPSDGEPFEPRRDLATIGLAVAAAMEKTPYLPSRVEVATSLPSVWFRPDRMAEVERCIAAIRGTVSISAVRASDRAERHHMFVVFLSETENATHGQQLTAAVRGEFDDSSAVAVAVDDLLCVIVSRPIWHGARRVDTHREVLGYLHRCRDVLRAEFEGG